MVAPPQLLRDFVVWWGLGLLGVAARAPWSLFGPALMAVLLLRLSGVTLLEKTIGERRRGYPADAARTSAFFPLPPRR
jgi:steroid 5-alpha reductase family enzyme